MRWKRAALPLAAIILSAAALVPGTRAIPFLSLVAVLVGFPLAIAPLWTRRLPQNASGLSRAGPALHAAAALLLAMLPLTLATALGLVGVRLSILSVIVPGLAIAAGLFVLLLARGPARREAPPADFWRGSGGWPGMLAAVPALLVLILAAKHGTPLGSTDDALDHLASLRHLVETDRLEFPGAFYGADLPAGQDPRKGCLLAGLAVAARLSGTDVISAWKGSAVVLSPLLVIAFASLALVLFRRWWAALASTLALVLLWGDAFWLLRGAYGGHWGLGIAWAGTALLLAGAGPGWGIVAGLAAAAVHAFAPFQLLVPAGFVYLFQRLQRAGERPVRGTALAGAFVGAAPLEVARKLLAGPSANPLHDQSMAWLSTRFGPVASPLQLLEWFGYAGALLVPAVILLALWRRDRPGFFLLAAALGPLLLLENPFLFSPVGRWLGSVGNKLALVWSYPLAIGWLPILLLDRRGRFFRAVAAAIALGVAGLVVMSLPARFDSWRVGPPALPRPMDEAAAQILSCTPPGAVIASDPMTSYAIPALTGRRTIVTLNQHAPPGDARAPDRLRIAAELFSTCLPLETALQQIGREGARYFLYPGTAGLRRDEPGSHADPRNGPLLAARFASRPDLLRREAAAEADGPVLYRLVGDLKADLLPDADLTPAGAGLQPASIFPPDGPIVSDGTVSIAVESFPLASLRRGEVFRLPAAWRLERPAPGYVEYSGHIRFENKALPRMNKPMSLIAKPLRRLFLEPRVGGSYRWRRVEVPFRGLCPVSVWPTGRWMPDTLEVVVPEQLLVGRYQVRIGLQRETLYPVVTAADLFEDTDRYSGPIAGTLEIQ